MGIDSRRLAWHDVACPEGPECRSRDLHSSSLPIFRTGLLDRYHERLSELIREATPKGSVPLLDKPGGEVIGSVSRSGTITLDNPYWQGVMTSPGPFSLFGDLPQNHSTGPSAPKPSIYEALKTVIEKVDAARPLVKEVQVTEDFYAKLSRAASEQVQARTPDPIYDTVLGIPVVIDETVPNPPGWRIVRNEEKD